MMARLRRWLLLGILMSLTALPVQAMSLHPIARVSALGGQYFTGETHSSGLNAEVYAVPVVTVSPRLHLIPIYMGSYRRVQSVYNFLGENTLIDKDLEQMGVLRLSWEARPDWRVKPRAGYKYSWIKQSTDESLSGGLFNNQRLFGGVSLERAFAGGRAEVGYDYSLTRYPNYQALDADPRLTTTGITSSAGTDVLDFNTHETTLQWTRLFAGRALELQASFTWLRQQFIDQKVITQTSDGFEGFLDKRRRDDIYHLSLDQIWRGSQQWQWSLGESLQHYASNQNAFDATQLFVNPYTDGYYDYVDAQLAPQVSRRWKEGVFEATLGGKFGYRIYSHRRAQNGAGTYLDSRIWSANRGGTLTLRYRLPVAAKVHVQMTSSVITYRSNTRYEANYPYNYTTAHYLAGLSWEY